MNTTTITMEQQDAREKLAEIMRSNRRKLSLEFLRLKACYEQLAKGAALIDVTQAIEEGGFDEKGRPFLAIARADRRYVRFRQGYNQTACEFDSRAKSQNDGWSRQNEQLIEVFDFGREIGNRRISAWARVPMVPPSVSYSGSLRDYWILWEVERWSDKHFDAEPPTDPYLLRPTGIDNLYAIVAEWDLTPLERAVMRSIVPEA